MSTTPIHSLTDTWNDVSTTFTAIGIDVTDTASADGSLLFDLKVGGTSLFRVDKSGFIPDTVFGIADDGDRTKRVRFQASGITTGTTRTKTFQDVSGTIYETGGTDVSVADGGTGASVSGTAKDNLRVSLATIAALTALTKASLTDGERVYVQSYSSSLVGYGGGWFRWDSSATDTANSVTIFASDEGGTGRWFRIYDWLTPEMAGAVGDSDGTAGNGTDDTAAFRLLGAVLEANNGGKVRNRQGAIYRIYSTPADTSDIFVINNVDGFEWDFAGSTLYADRDIRTEATTVFPFQFNDGQNVRIYGGKLSTRSRTINQTSDVYGMRWFYFTGTGSTIRFDMESEYSVDPILIQRIADTDALTDRWTDLDIHSTALQNTYACALADSGDDVRLHIDGNGCFRTLIAYGVANVRGTVKSKNHLGGDLRLHAHHESGAEDAHLKDVSIDYYVEAADHAETFNAGANVFIENRGVDGATIENVHIRAHIDSNNSKPELQAVIWEKTTDGGAGDDATGSRGHVVRNCSISLHHENASSAAGVGGRLVELFHPTYNGNWTGETIEGFRLENTSIKGAATADIEFGLTGHADGPLLRNVSTVSDLNFNGTASNSAQLFSVNTANITAPLSVGTVGNVTIPSFIRSSGGNVMRVGSTTGVPTLVISSNAGGGNFAGELAFEDEGAAVASFKATADGTLRVYVDDSSASTWAARWSASGHYEPGADSTFDLGATGTRWRNVYADDYEATTSYSVAGSQVVGARGSAVGKITTTASSGTLPTPDGSVTIADASTPTVTELLEYCVELEAKLELIIDRIGASAGHGLTSD